MCELWLIVDAGEPVLLGMLPKQGLMQVVFSQRITSLKNWQQLVQKGKLVISVESSEGTYSGYNMSLWFYKGLGLVLLKPTISL